MKPDLPMFDPVVASHFAEASSYTGTLMDEIFERELYAPLFKDKSDLTFLDIGANIGLVSVYAYPSCKRIVAIEPAPDTFAVLRAIAVAHPKIEPFQVALSDANDTCEFFVNNENSTASSIVNTFGKRIIVNGLTLQSILNGYQLEHVDVCKVDVEGAEGDALSLYELNLAKDIVDTWLIETHNCPLTTYQHKMDRIARDLSALGYRDVSTTGMTVVARK